MKSSYLSINENKVLAWVETKDDIEEYEKENIEKLVNQFLMGENFEAISVHFMKAKEVPSQSSILRAIHTLSPCSIDDLLKDLEYKKFKIPDKTWLNHSIDKIRKSGWVIRLTSGYYKDNYILSLKGLLLVGTIKNRYSPDVKRVLAITKRGC